MSCCETVNEAPTRIRQERKKTCLAKWPNKHNRIYLTAEPMSAERSAMEVSADPVYQTEVLTERLADELADSPRRACVSMLGAHARQGLQPALQQVEKAHMVRPSHWKPRRLRSSRRCSAIFGPANRSATAWRAWVAESGQAS